MFLTKSPEMLKDYMFLPHNNVMVGLTITGLETKEELIKKYYHMDFNRKFLSIEPLLGEVKALPLSKYEHIIIGAMTGKNKIEPKKEWLESINKNIIKINYSRAYYKKNIKKYLTKENKNG